MSQLALEEPPLQAKKLRKSEPLSKKDLKEPQKEERQKNEEQKEESKGTPTEEKDRSLKQYLA